MTSLDSRFTTSLSRSERVRIGAVVSSERRLSSVGLSPGAYTSSAFPTCSRPVPEAYITSFMWRISCAAALGLPPPRMSPMAFHTSSSVRRPFSSTRVFTPEIAAPAIICAQSTSGLPPESLETSETIVPSFRPHPGRASAMGPVDTSISSPSRRLTNIKLVACKPTTWPRPLLLPVSSKALGCPGAPCHTRSCHPRRGWKWGQATRRMTGAWPSRFFRPCAPRRSSSGAPGGTGSCTARPSRPPAPPREGRRRRPGPCTRGTCPDMRPNQRRTGRCWRNRPASKIPHPPAPAERHRAIRPPSGTRAFERSSRNSRFPSPLRHPKPGAIDDLLVGGVDHLLGQLPDRPVAVVAEVLRNVHRLLLAHLQKADDRQQPAVTDGVLRRLDGPDVEPLADRVAPPTQVCRLQALPVLLGLLVRLQVLSADPLPFRDDQGHVPGLHHEQLTRWNQTPEGAEVLTDGVLRRLDGPDVEPLADRVAPPTQVCRLQALPVLLGLLVRLQVLSADPLPFRDDQVHVPGLHHEQLTRWNQTPEGAEVVTDQELSGDHEAILGSTSDGLRNRLWAPSKSMTRSAVLPPRFLARMMSASLPRAVSGSILNGRWTRITRLASCSIWPDWRRSVNFGLPSSRLADSRLSCASAMMTTRSVRANLRSPSETIATSTVGLPVGLSGFTSWR